MIYLLCFGASALCAHFAYKASSLSDIKKRRMFVLLFSVFAVLIPTVLAGLRDYSIGIDTHNYLRLNRFWVSASKADSLRAYFDRYMTTGHGEPLFALLLGSIAQVFGNYSVFLFAVHAFIMTGIYVGAYRFRKVVNPAVVLMLFFLIFYNHSLNIIRQYMAMSFIFAFMADIHQKKYWRYILAVFFAYFIHKSAAFGIFVLFVFWFLHIDVEQIVVFMRRMWSFVRNAWNRSPKKAVRDKHAKKIKLPRIFYATVEQRRVVLYAIMLFAVLVFNPLCRLFINVGLLHEKYDYYLDITSAEYAALNTLFLLVEMVPLVLFRKKLFRKDPVADFYATLSGSYLILYQLSAFLYYGKRVALYFGLPNLVTLAMLPALYANSDVFENIKWFKNRELFKKFVYLAVFGAAFAYWLYVYVFRNASKTVPYLWIFGT